MQAKFILAIIAFFAVLCVATATLTQADLMTTEELSLLAQQIKMGLFDEDELVLISQALEQQELFLVESTNKGFWAKTKNFFNNTYVQYTGLGLATALALVALVALTVFAVKKIRATKKDKQEIAAVEEEKGLLTPYDTVV